MKNPGLGKTILYSLLPTLLLVLAVEGSFRIVEVWHPPLPADYGCGFDDASRVFTPDPTVPGRMITSRSKLVVFQDEAFLSPKPDRVFRMFAVGGSSVNYAIDHLRAIADNLTKRSGNRTTFEMINAGGCGYGSHRLTAVVAEVLEYQPDAILFYEANNEFEENEQLQLVQLRALPLQKLLGHSAFCRFVRDRLAMRQLGDIRRKRNLEILAMEPKDNGSWAEKTFTTAQIDERMRVYEKNLTLITQLCKAKKVPLILASVPSNLVNPRLPDKTTLDSIHALFAAGKRDEGAALARETLIHSTRHQASDTENAIVRKVARENGVPLADVEARVIAAEPHRIPGETLFDDWCHLNDAGREIMAAAFEEQVATLPGD